MLKHIITILFGTFMFSQTPDWEYDPGAWQYYSWIVAADILNDDDNDGNFYIEEGDLLVAFDEDGNVRGVSEQVVPDFGPYDGTILFEMTIGSNNTQGDMILFKYYDASDDIVLNILDNYIFVNQETQGSLLDPIYYTLDFTPDLFSFNISVQAAYCYIEQASINNIQIDSEDWIGAFNGDICVGSRQWDTSTCNNDICDIPLMGNDGYEYSSGYMQSGDIPSFKIYDASEDTYYNANYLEPAEDVEWENFKFIFINTLNASSVILGCMDESACNYDITAVEDDGTCIYTDYCFDCNGNTTEDECGVCYGDNSTCLDECGIPNGDNSTCLDECGIPNGDNSVCADCLGVPNGDNEEDMCGTCDSDNGNNCIQDCEGIWGGDVSLDECGVCGGDNSTCADCLGVPNGDNEEDMCGTCDSDNGNDCIQDCEGNWGGEALLDDCGVCGSDQFDGDVDEDGNICETECTGDLDCAGICDGDTVLDECGVCGGEGISEGACDCEGNIDLGCGCDEPGPSGCDNACGSTLVIDECGNCGGDGINEGACDCDGNIEDCSGVCGGPSELDECGICNGDGTSCNGICNDMNACNYGDEGDCSYHVDCNNDCAGIDWDCAEWSNDEQLVGSWVEVSNTSFDNDDCNGEAENNTYNMHSHSTTLNSDGTASITIMIIDDDEPMYCQDVSECINPFEGYVCSDDPYDQPYQNINECEDECGGECYWDIILDSDLECGNYNVCQITTDYTWATNDGTLCRAHELFGSECISYEINNSGDLEITNIDLGYGGSEGGCEITIFSPIDCSGAMYGDLELDDCGVCGGDNSCFDDCGVAYGDNSSCADCAGIPNGETEYDDCGVCGGDNVDCWFLDIKTSINSTFDSDSRIGMHIAAEDGYNDETNESFVCDNCYKDEIDVKWNDPTNWIDFYFPHPEWENDIPEIFESTDIRKDIRKFREFTLEDLHIDNAIYLDETMYFPQQIWDVVIETDQGNSWGNHQVDLDFNFINQIPNQGFTKAFVYLNTNEGEIVQEITDSSTFTINNYTNPTQLQIIVGTSDLMPSIAIIEPIANEILPINEDLQLELDIKNENLIQRMYLLFEVNGIYSDTIDIEIDPYFSLVYDSSNPLYEATFATFFNEQMENKDYIDNVYLHVNIIDDAGGNANNHLEYGDKVGPFTFSKNESNISFDNGLHLIAPPFSTNYSLENLFGSPAYHCSNGCSILEEAYSGLGFYVESDGTLPVITFIADNNDVLSEYSISVNEGWNLIGNPLVEPIDVNIIMIDFQNISYDWFEAAKAGIISPTPIIYNNEKVRHEGTDELQTAAGFWVKSFYDNVEISFVPYCTEICDDEGNCLEPDDCEVNYKSAPENSKYWNLSLFAKEAAEGSNGLKSIGSEIVIGINEEADDSFVEGEDQEILPLDLLNIDALDRYTQLSIDNANYDGQSMIYRDIRSYHDTSITWNVNIDLVNPFDLSNGIELSWLFRGNDDPYDYFLKDSHGNEINMNDPAYNLEDDLYGLIVDNNNLDIDSGLSITAVLKDEYIGCTFPGAQNENLGPDGSECTGGICLGGDQADYCEILALTLPDEFSIDENNQSFSLPVSLSNPGNISIEGIQFDLEYDSNIIQFNQAVLDSSLSDLYIIDWADVPCDNCQGNSRFKVTVYFIGNHDSLMTTVPSSEVLSIHGYGLQATESTIVSLESVQINENQNSVGNQCEVTIGLVLFDFSGNMVYYLNSTIIPDVSIQLDPTSIDIVYNEVSDHNGIYEFNDIYSSNYYQITLSKDDMIDDNYYDGLSAVDASRIARYVNKTLNLSESEVELFETAANVNFDFKCYNDITGETEFSVSTKSECTQVINNQPGYEWVANINSNDAAKVARFAAGITSALDIAPVGDLDYTECNPNWLFMHPDYYESDRLMFHADRSDANFCQNKPYEISVSSDISNIQFKGIRLGDVTGNWTAPLSRNNEQEYVQNPDINIDLDEIINLPIYISSDEEIEGIDLTIQYDPNVFELLGFNDRNSILDRSFYSTIINTEIEGSLTLVSYANTSTIAGSGLLGYIKFKVKSEGIKNSTIDIYEMNINDISSGGFLMDDGRLTRGFDYNIISMPSEFALKGNYPNPFNPITNIRFEIPEICKVNMSIYDIRGALIEEVINSQVEAGYHEVVWDASALSSGIYFVHMSSKNNDFQKTMKISLLK